jgi:2-methylcitrate dehydratase PrpD
MSSQAQVFPAMTEQTDSLDRAVDATLDWLWHADPLAEPAVLAKARLLLLDTLGCAIAGLRKPELSALAAHLGLSDPGSARWPGLVQSLSPMAGASLFAITACWDEACEGLARAHGRPGLHALPPVVALALAQKRSLGDVLRAMVRGYEVGGRLGAALRIKSGMHVDGTWGQMAAAVAAASLIGGRDTARAALDAAACQVPQSLYRPVAQGATARNTYVGHAAAMGLFLAQSVAAGVTAPTGSIADWWRIALGGTGALPTLIPAGEWLVVEGYLKPYAAVRHVHYGAQAAADWHRRFGDGTQRIESLQLDIYPEAITYCGNRNPQAAIQAQFSLSYGLAHALRHGDLGPDAYTAAALADPETRRLESLVQIAPDEFLAQGGRRGAHLTVGAEGGSETIGVTQVPGDPGLPMTEDEAKAKFLRYASPSVDRADSLAARILSADLTDTLPAVLA